MWYPSKKSRLERRAARAFGLKHYAVAIQALEELLDVVGENPNTLHILAVCRQRRGEEGAAIAAATRGLAADPAHLRCLKLLAEVHAGRGEVETARVYATRALALMDVAGSNPAPERSLVRVLATLGSRYSGGLGVDDLEWSRWARALCDESSDTDPT